MEMQKRQYGRHNSLAMMSFENPVDLSDRDMLINES